ncbi:MAG TPA: pyrimidine 5'-nucleotidase [Geobacteraceae bacterium]|nr:pyrimidine 5'-nucleotidase [Geobacteraceae bacterium]
MDYILFDLDNTLYTTEWELFTLIDQRINRYMNEVVGIPQAEVDTLRRSYWHRYGVTMRGLMRHHGVDPEDYLSYVHDIDVSSKLHPDPVLREALATIPLRRAIFTNSSRDHSERVLNALGLSGLFEEIFDIRIANYLPKPSPEPYYAVLDRIGIPASRCIMVEDSPENLRTAKKLGMGTILVGERHCTDCADSHVATAREVPEALALWFPA